MMDVSLPGIDGVRATRLIRELPGREARRIPIIAMSAHVFKDEIAQHLDAGMDTFVGKPVSPERLAEALADVLLVGRRGIARPAGEVWAEGEAVLDPATLRGDYLILGAERTGRMVEAFRGATPGQVAELAAAVDGRDWGRIEFLAHTLKGGAGSLGLLALESRSHALEAAAKAEDSDAVAGAHGDFGDLHARSLKALDEAWLGVAGAEAGARKFQSKAPLSAAKK